MWCFSAVGRMEGLGERIRAAAERIGGLEALSERLTDVSRRTLTDWASDKTEPRASSIAEICELTGATYAWLLAGEGEAFFTPNTVIQTLSQLVKAPGLTGNAAQDVIDPAMGSGGLLISASRALQAIKSEEELIALPFYEDVAASAGHGALAASERTDAIIAFARKFLLSKGATPENCTIIRATGDSMHPNIPDGSLLVIDHGQTEARNGHIMVINLGDDLLVKRIRRRLDGLVDLISDNPAYAAETVGADRIQQLRIIGRVVYFCRAP